MYKGSLFLVLLTAFTIAELVHPDSLNYSNYNWEVPTGDSYRSTVGSTVLYFAEDRSLPLFSLKFSFRAGSLYEAENESGVSALHSMILRNGGSKKYEPAQIDSLLDHYALSLSVLASGDKTDITLFGLSQYFEIGSEILLDVFNNPLFDSARVVQNREQMIQSINHRFDNPAPVLSVAWSKTLYPNSPVSDLLKKSDVEKLNKKKLSNYHSFIKNDAEVLVGASGNVSLKKIKNLLEKMVGKNRKVKNRELPKIVCSSQPKVVIVHKDISQAYVKTGVAGFKRSNNRYYPLTLFNEVLGAGGFDSRLVSEVRSNAGLTYSIRSSIGSNYTYPSTFNITFSTKQESVNHALFLTKNIVDESAVEILDSALIESKKDQFLATIPSSFKRKKDIVFTYLWNEFYGRDPNHFVNYKSRLDSISVDSIAKVSSSFLNRDFTTVIVGDSTQILSAPEWEGETIKGLKPTVILEEDLLK
jgi:zinc protease